MVRPGLVGTASRPGPTAPVPSLAGSGTSPTTTMPLMPMPPGAPWSLQLNAYTPGFVKVRLKSWPFWRIPESKEPSSAVTVCGFRPSFLNSTVVPGSTRRTWGSKKSSRLRTTFCWGVASVVPLGP